MFIISHRKIIHNVHIYISSMVCIRLFEVKLMTLGSRESGPGFRNAFILFLFLGEVRLTRPFNRPSDALIRKAISP